ncbi:MAG TPA: glutamate--cysteine ligase [Myxococcota bacterium]|nr:glutamate--cysteine ligase [Myxococcota bacterium]
MLETRDAARPVALAPVEFKGSPRPTMGVEVELQLVDAQTRDLCARAPDLLAALEDPVHFKPEVIASCVEVVTGVCDTAADVRRDLAPRLARLRAAAAARGVRLAATGTHPFARPAEQRITDSDRYRRLLDSMQWPARSIVIFGLHVHVGVPTGARAVALVDALAAYIPHLLALTASSPFWCAEDTGLASVRAKIFEALPTAGLPPRLGDWNEFMRFLDALRRAHSIESIREVWWDVRPHPGFGTVEVRCCDAVNGLDGVVAVAALVQALVVWLGERLGDGGGAAEAAVPVPEWMVKENKWRAARHGMDARLLTDTSGTVRPVRAEIEALLGALEPVAARLGGGAELAGVARLLREAPSYARQRQALAARGGLAGVVDALADEFEGSF